MKFRIHPLLLESVVWTGAITILATMIGRQVDWGNRLERPLPDIRWASPEFSAPALAEMSPLAGDDQYLEMLNRPLFVVTRRPPPPPPPPPPPVEVKPVMQKGLFALLGTTVTPDGSAAFLQEKSTKKVRVVKEGQEINGILVKKVDALGVTLTQYDEEENLSLKVVVPPAPPPQAPGMGGMAGSAIAPAPANASTPDKKQPNSAQARTQRAQRNRPAPDGSAGGITQ